MSEYTLTLMPYETLINKVNFLEEDLPFTNGSIGLKYNIYGTHAVLTDLGECTDSPVVIGGIVCGRNVTTIESKAFICQRSLTSVVIPGTVTDIKMSAFFGCTGLTNVYYRGSEEDWATINIESGNHHLTNATIHYNSEV